MIRVGLISDTHGLIRDEAVSALAGCRHIIHAGDIGAPDVLAKLQGLAPVTAVRGNNDKGLWASALPANEVAEFGTVLVYVLHDRSELGIDLDGAGFQVVVFGHSHQPMVESRDGVLLVNPGSAGPRRFKLPVTVGELLISNSRVEAHIIELAV